MTNLNRITKKRPLFNLRTSLDNIPKDWLRHVEPKVNRTTYPPCWLWEGSCDSRGYPVIIDTFKGARSEIKVHRYVAKMFYDFPKSVRVKRSCGNLQCVNPNHIKVAIQQ